jgi:hypothetical protein
VRRLIAVLAALSACCACATTPAAVTTRVSHATSHRAHPGSSIRHVFVIVEENESYTDSYVHNPNHYLGRALQRQGTLLTHYYAIGHVSLDNYLAMMSGQAPNPDTSSDCMRYTDFNGTKQPATLTPSGGQAVGVGCVYPTNVKTLADQLSAHHIRWRGYMDQMGRMPSREQKRCGIPSVNRAGLDQTQTATKKDQYAARHNPFVYFHSLIDSGRCKRHVVPLGRLHHSLRHIRTTPRFVFITPDLCDDGHDSPCAGKDVSGSNAGGLASVDHFLKKYIPMIKASPAYRKNGLIIITSDESETSDTASCCGEQPGPSDPMPGISGPGGGRIGALLIGHCVRHGRRDPRPYNHYSLLRSLENLYGIRTGGTDGHGHLGYAAATGLRPFGSELFSAC